MTRGQYIVGGSHLYNQMECKSRILNPDQGGTICEVQLAVQIDSAG